MINIAFVILTWNSEDCIGACLDSLMRLGDVLSGHVVIIDNGSTDGTVKLIQDKIKQFDQNQRFKYKLISLSKNLGTTISRNKGIKYLLDSGLSFDFLCVLDSDTEMNAAAVLSMVRELERNPDIGIIGPRMHDRNHVYQESGRSIPSLSEKVMKVIPISSIRAKGEKLQRMIEKQGKGCVDVGYLMAACWLIPRSALLQIGLLDENIFYAPEDVDYCIRCWRSGLRVVLCYDADIVHQWQRLSRKKFFSKHNYEHVKGLFYLFCKHGYISDGSKFMK